MGKLLIKNGLVFDPLNGIQGEIKDILIEDGKIVEKFSSDKGSKTIDAKNKTVVPAALDIHTHIASQQVNWVRLLGANNSTYKQIWNRLTLEYIAKSYIVNGYTFILEANVFPSLAKHTIFNFQHLPVLDKAQLLNVSNLWPLELEFQRGKIDSMAVFLSDLLSKTKGFGFKVYNPFESESWNFNILRKEISSKGRLYNFSGLDVYENLTKVNEFLNLPHSIHAHIEGYEHLKAKNNLFTILNAIKALNLESPSERTDSKKRSQIFHIAHASAYNVDGNNIELINLLNENKGIDIDLGCIGFNEINPLITSDRRLIHTLMQNNNTEHNTKIITSAVEFEGDTFASLRKFDKKNLQDCIMWANSIDLALKVHNKWQVQLSVNYPNYADINDIPQIASWLISKQARDNFMQGMNEAFLTNNNLSENDGTLTFYDFVILTRASPAKSLGIANIKGNLDAGADGDLNILDINLDKVDIAKNYTALKDALSNIEYVIKNGEIIKHQEKIDLNPRGKIFWTQGTVAVDNKDLIMNSKMDFYQKYGSIFYKSMEISIANEQLRLIE